MLDEYQVVMHSSDSIAPVGILHPLAFHLENKADTQSLRSQDNKHETEKLGNVFEVQDCLERCDPICKPVDHIADLIDVSKLKFQFSRTKNKSTFSLCCWLQDSCSGLDSSSFSISFNDFNSLFRLSFFFLFIYLFILAISLFLCCRFIGRS